MIAAKPRGSRRGGRGSRSGGGARGGAAAEGGAARGAAGARARYSGSAPRNASQTQRAAAAPAAAKPITADATKIIISNLPTDVTEAQVRDLMQSTVGPVRNLQMSFTATGKSTGTATVIFKNRGDANKAHASCTPITRKRRLTQRPQPDDRQPLVFSPANPPLSSLPPLLAMASLT